MGCVTDKDELKLVAPDAKPTDCEILMVAELRPSARADVRSGLPLMNRDDAIQALRRIAVNDRLPLCKTPEQLATETPTPAPTTTAEPAPSPESETPTPTPEPSPTTTSVQTPGTNCRSAK